MTLASGYVSTLQALSGCAGIKRYFSRLALAMISLAALWAFVINLIIVSSSCSERSFEISSTATPIGIM
jgi:hypothetical protein